MHKLTKTYFIPLLKNIITFQCHTFEICNYFMCFNFLQEYPPLSNASFAAQSYFLKEKWQYSISELHNSKCFHPNPNLDLLHILIDLKYYSMLIENSGDSRLSEPNWTCATSSPFILVLSASFLFCALLQADNASVIWNTK